MNTGRPMEHDLLFDFLRVVEAAAIEAARTMGRGDRKYSDHVAVETMREVMDTIPMEGTVVIGEGERDEAPMLYIGERVGMGAKDGNTRHYPEIDIAVDPLEGTNLCATGAANAIAVLAAAERGGLLHAPDIYMDKIVVGPSVRGAVDIDAPVKENLNAIAARLRRKVEDLTVIVLDRPRHRKLIQDIRDAGARIRLITDGDLSAGISAAVAGSGVHALMGIGGGPEGVITAAAMKCLNGEIQSRFVMKEQLEQAEDRAEIPDGLVQLLFQDEAGLDFAVQTFHGGGRDHAFWAAAYAHQRMDARPGDGRRDSGRQIAVGDQAYARAGVANVLNEFTMAGAVQNYNR